MNDGALEQCPVRRPVVCRLSMWCRMWFRLEARTRENQHGRCAFITSHLFYVYYVRAFFLYCCSHAQTPSSVHYSVFAPLLLSLGSIVLETIDTSQAAPHKEY